MAVIRVGRVHSKMSRLRGDLVGLLVVLSLVVSSFANPAGKGCDSVKQKLLLRGFPADGMLDVPQNGVTCGEDSCCSNKLENEFVTYSQASLEKYVRDSVAKVSSLLENRAKRFDDIFRHMMEESKREFHDMFERTYGKIYLQNADVFSDFFSELETYYKKGTVRLSETMDTFFGILYQRMFTVINQQYSFDENYMVCVSNHMLEMRPFGDVPHKLTLQLKRAFVATRTFYKSLMKGVELLRGVPSVRMEDECLQQQVRMQMCGICRYEMTACSSYCTDTLNSCLRHHVQLNEAWDNFISAIDRVGDRLMGPYNVEAVVEPLNIKISEAIMNFQEVGAEVSQKIQAKCGTLGLKRSVREVEDTVPSEESPSGEIPQQSYKFNHAKDNKEKKHKKGQQQREDATPGLDKVIEDIQNRVKTTRNFWMQLPYHYCNNATISSDPSADGDCWNGTAISTYAKQPAVPAPTPNPFLSQVAHEYTILTDKLRKAYQGEDVEIVDDTEEGFETSGSGSGDDEDDDDDDDIENREPDKDIVFNPETAQPSTPPPAGSSTAPEVVMVMNTSGASRSTTSMSLTRALLQYLLPIVMVWFGGAIKDLL